MRAYRVEFWEESASDEGESPEEIFSLFSSTFILESSVSVVSVLVSVSLAASCPACVLLFSSVLIWFDTD